MEIKRLYKQCVFYSEKNYQAGCTALTRTPSQNTCEHCKFFKTYTQHHREQERSNQILKHKGLIAVEDTVDRDGKLCKIKTTMTLEEFNAKQNKSVGSDVASTAIKADCEGWA